MPRRGRKEPIMAQKNIVVADQGLKVVLFPKAKEPGTRYPLNAAQSKAVRKHVREYVAADSRDLPYDERLSQNLRVGLKRGNGMVPGILAIMGKGQAQPQSGEVRVYIDESKKSGNSTQNQGGSTQAAAAGTGARKRTKSDLTKMTKADLVRLLEEAGLTK